MTASNKFVAKNTYWDKHARRYDRVTKLLNRHFVNMADAVAATLDDHSRVLEIAAGTGLVTASIAQRVQHLVATDASPEMLAVLRARLERLGLNKVEVQPADATRLPFADASFSAVVMANVLHLLPQPERALAEARRVLVKDGLLVAPTFCHNQNLLARGVSRLLGASGFPIATRFSDNSLLNLIEQNGFAVVKRSNFAGLLPLALLAARPAD